MIETFVVSNCRTIQGSHGSMRHSGAKQEVDWLEADCAQTKTVWRAVEQQFEEIGGAMVGNLTDDVWYA